MTREELKRAMVLDKWISGHLTETDVASALGISVRQAYRLKAKYVHGGAQVLAHQNRGRKPIHTLSDELKQRVADLYRGPYHGSNAVHYAELLQERENIKLSVSSVRRILIEHGLKLPRTRRSFVKTHRPRTRKPQAGMLWQIDSSPFAWLEDRGPSLTLHGIIDDATGEVLGAVFRPTETFEGYALAMMQALRSRGVPMALYSDRHTIFRSPQEALTLEQELAGETKPLSNFGKAVADLGITHIKALSPQAKGRIERLWQTFQDRLVIELRLLGVCSEQEANRVLPSLLKKHNRRFAVKPQQVESAYRPLPNELKLEHVFTRREIRKMGGGQTFSWNGKCYTPTPVKGLPLWEPKAVIEVRETMQGEVLIWHNNRAWICTETTRQAKPVANVANKKSEPATPRKPAADHPWRKGFTNTRFQRSIAR